MRKLHTLIILLLCFPFMTLSAKGVCTRVWDHPVAEVNYNNHDGYFKSVIAPVRVGFMPDRTVLDMEIRFRPDFWFTISSGTVLMVGDRSYALIGVDGIDLDKKTFCPRAGVKTFRLFFEPLPTDTKQFDFKESDDYHIKGITDPAITARQLLPSTWRNDCTGDWEIGLFDEGVVYDAKFWNYAGTSRPADGGSFEMTDGERTLRVKIGKLKNGTRKIRVGDNPDAVCSMITSRTLPDYPVADTRAEFVDNRYALGDTVEFRGWLKDSPERIKLYSLLCKNLVSLDFGDAAVCDVDSLGRFSMKIPLLNSTECFIDWNNTYIRTILEPGNTYFLFYDFGRGQKLFMGSDCRLQNELLSYPLTWSQLGDQLLRTHGADVYLNAVKSELNTDLQTLDSLYASHPTLSQRFRNFSEGNIYTRYAGNIGQTRFSAPDDKLTDVSVGFLTDIFRNHISRPYPIHRDYFLYINDFVDDLINKNPAWLAGDTTDAVTDQASLDMQHNAYMLKYLRRGVEVIDSLGGDEDARSLWVIQSIADHLDNTHRPLTSALANFVKDTVHLPGPLHLVMAKNEMYQALEQRVRDSSSDLGMRTLPVAEGVNDGKILLDSIIAPHKGKIILLDVWGTWCAPCRAALANSQEEFTELAPYDIVYIYLANNSPEDSWRNLIEEYDVKGENCFHYNLPPEQQALIERYLNVSSFPTYLLFDREGNLLPYSVDARNLPGLHYILDRL